MRMMSRCFTRCPISGLGEPNIYHDSGGFYKNVGILLGGLKWKGVNSSIVLVQRELEFSMF